MKTINGQELKQLFLSGANNLYNHYPEVDKLNVFPVPDGDTGMNMNLTLTSGAKEIENKNDIAISVIAQSFSRGLLMGARGNSGVITSQIFKGFSNACAGKKQLNVREFAEAFLSAKETAYKAVMRPVEGTILTVIREASSALVDRVKDSFTIEQALDILLEEAKKSLAHTPDLLPVLKQVGVVDSGGAGLTIVFEGMAKAAHGKFVERETNPAKDEMSSPIIAPETYAGAQLSEDEEGYGYCTQFILRLGKPEDGKKPFVEKNFQKFLSNNGNSLVLVRDDDIVKVHVHTLTPGTMLNYAQNYGEFLTITIENMSEEHHNIQNGSVATDMFGNIERHRMAKKEEERPWTDFGVIAVSSGEGLDEMFKELGVDVIVSGGQTMNPSTEDFVKAVTEIHAHNVYILPNNGNIVMAANQAAEVIDTEGVKVNVIPSKTIPQGIASLMQYSTEMSAEEITESMKEALGMIKSGSVTYAIKDTDINGVHVTKDYYMGMKEDKEIVSCVKDKLEALKSLVASLVNEDSFALSIYVGKDCSEKEEKEVSEYMSETYPNLEVNVRKGGQPVYSFLVGVE